MRERPTVEIPEGPQSVRARTRRPAISRWLRYLADCYDRGEAEGCSVHHSGDDECRIVVVIDAMAPLPPDLEGIEDVEKGDILKQDAAPRETDDVDTAVHELPEEP